MLKAGCLLIHGIGGNTGEVEPLLLRLQNDGFVAKATRLKGHTGKRQDLAGVRYSEWIDSAESDLLELQSGCDIVFVIGFSMGGLIAANLVLKHNIGGIVTINTPIYYWNVKSATDKLLSDIRNKDFVTIKRYLKSSNELPLNALYNFQLLLSSTKPKLKEIGCPIFIAQALHDDAVQKSSADYINNHVASKLKKLKFYDSSHHLILWSPEADEVIEDTVGFVKLVMGDR